MQYNERPPGRVVVDVGMPGRHGIIVSFCVLLFWLHLPTPSLPYRCSFYLVSSCLTSWVASSFGTFQVPSSFATEETVIWLMSLCLLSLSFHHFMRAVLMNVWLIPLLSGEIRTLHTTRRYCCPNEWIRMHQRMRVVHHLYHHLLNVMNLLYHWPVSHSFLRFPSLLLLWSF